MLEQFPYSFSREEYIHPRIVQEMGGLLSDKNETIVAVDLIAANKSNRFFGDIWTEQRDGGLWVGWKGQEEEYAYRYIATSPSGIHIVHSYNWTGGTENSCPFFCLRSIMTERFKWGRPEFC